MSDRIIVLPERACRDKALTAKDLRLLMTIGIQGGNESLRSLAIDQGVRVTTLAKQLEHLAALGYLVLYKHDVTGADYLTNICRVKLEGGAV